MTGTAKLLAALHQAKEALEWVIDQGGGPRCEHEAGVCFCKEVAAISRISEALAAEAGGEEMTGNHWTVFNSAGGVVCDNMPLDVVHAYMTPERFERGWNAVYCLVVRCEEDLPPLSDSRKSPAEKQE